MSFWGTLDRPKQLFILGAIAALVAGAGVVGWRAMQPGRDIPVAGQQGAVPAKVAGDGAAAVTPPDPQPAAVPPDPPRIDTWRVAADGQALVAGFAAPGSTIAVLLDGTKVAFGTVGANGDFAVLFTLAPRKAPSLMGLTMTMPDGVVIPSANRVALGPIPGPVEDTVAGAGEPQADAQDPTEPLVGLLVSQEGAVVLQGEPAKPTQVVIDTITYAPDGAVQIGGRAAAGAALRLYLDNAAVATTTAAANGTWQVTLGDTEPKVYTLRVDQLDGKGAVLSRFETPFKREAVEALAALAGPPVAPEPPEVPAEPPAAPEPPGSTAQAQPETLPAPREPAAVATQAEPAGATAPAENGTAGTMAAAPPDSAAAPETALAGAEPATLAKPAPVEPAGAPVAPDPAPTAAPVVTITVQPGFTLWGIADDSYGDGALYVQLFQANADKIKDPDLIYPGQVFTVPEKASP